MTRTLKLELAALAAIAIGLGGCFFKPAGPRSVAGAELGNRPVDPNLAQRGGIVFRDKGCYGCHGFGRKLGAPDLAGVMERRDHAWLRRWLKSTDSMLVSDPQAEAMLKDWYGVRMPNMRLSDQQIEALFHYMAQETARVRGGGT